jgi:hypothetical protein
MDQIITHQLSLSRFHEGMEMVASGKQSIKVAITLD